MCAVLKMRVVCVSFKLMSPLANHTYLVDSHDSRDNIGAFLKHNGRPWLRRIDQRFEILCHIQTAVPAVVVESDTEGGAAECSFQNCIRQQPATRALKYTEHHERVKKKHKSRKRKARALATVGEQPQAPTARCNYLAMHVPWPLRCACARSLAPPAST